MTKSGKYYEKKTAEVLQNLNPTQVVQHNVKLLGKLSNKPRQIDVLIEPSEFDHLIFECKDHGRPIDLDTFGVFTSILDDVGRTGKAAMVSNSPYSEGVQNMAKSKEIDLLHVIDTNDPNIKTQLRAAVMLADTKLKSFQMQFQTTASFSSGITYDPIIKGPHFEGKGRDYLKFLWNNTELLKDETGTFNFVMSDAYVIAANGASIPFTVTFSYDVEEEYYLGDIEIQNTQGLFNIHEGSFQTKSLETAPLEPYEVEKFWKKVTKEEADKQKITFGVGCKSILG